LIYQHCIDGGSLQKIAKWLNDEQVKTVSGVWWPRSLSGLIKNPVYKGHRCKREVVSPDEVEERDGKVIRYRYGSIWVETPRWQFGKTIHCCEPLVDAALWRRANDVLNARPRRSYTDPENRAMLTGALFCPFCEDSPMYRHWVRNRWTLHFYYRCAGRGSKRQSCGNAVRVELVYAAVNEIMSDTFDVPVMRHGIVYGNEAEIETHVVVSRNSVSAGVDLSEPEPAARDTRPVYQGKCGCGCGTDLYGTKYGKKKYVNHAHRARADRRRLAAHT
jgi:hypothetical protein